MLRDKVERTTETAGTEQPAHSEKGTGAAHHDAAGRAAVTRMASEPDAPKLESHGGAFLVHAQPVRFPGTTVDAILPPATYVELGDITAATGESVLVKVYSGFDGQLALIPRNNLLAEPRMGHGSGADEDTPRDFTYVRYDGLLWNGVPRVEDVAQGYLGDCYLLTAMGAVVSADPQAIMAMFSPQSLHAPRYSVTLHRRRPDGSFIRHVEVVEPFLPTKQVEGPLTKAAYADNGRQRWDTSPTAKPLWPALLEKAYAQMLGGYDVVGQGGSPTTAMEAMTGRAGEERDVPGTDAELLQFLRGMQGKFAMAAATPNARIVRDQGGFKEIAPHQFRADFKTDQGEPAEILTHTLTVNYAAATANAASPADPASGVAGSGTESIARAPTDSADQVPTADDDGAGNLVGKGVSGVVAYEIGTVVVTYDPAMVKAKVDPALLRASYDWEGLLDKSLTVYASHAYIFERVSEDGLIHLRNPWGVLDPKPMTAADFRRLYVRVYSDAVPQKKDHPAPTATARQAKP